MREQGLTAQTARIAGVDIRYVRTGQGPPVFLVHGFASSLYSWKDVIPELARAHEVVALDLPAFGGSGMPLDFSAASFVGVVPGLMNQLGFERADLVGHSLGGAITTVLAAQQPQRVRRLVLVSAAAYAMEHKDRPWLVRVAGSAGGIAEHVPFRRSLVRAGLRQVFFDDRHVTDERVEEYLAPLARPGALGALQSLLGARGVWESGRIPDLVSRVKAPTLIVWGREDAWIPVAHADRYEAAIPGSRKVVLERCGHVPQEELPAETARLVADFLR